MRKLLYLLLVLAFWSCMQDSETEKHQSKRDNVINVRQRVKELLIYDVMIGSSNSLQLLGDYLIISDYKSFEKVIHVFDKKNFKYLTSFGNRGEGPNEITNMGFIAADEIHHKIYVSDHGKQLIFSYDLDSVLSDPFYMPKVKTKMDVILFPSEYQYFNDTLCIGRVIQPIGNNDFKPSVAKWNMATGEIKPMEYEHPEIEKKRIMYAASMKYDIYVECYNYHDLMTICDLNGKLKYNIYGPYWDNKKSNETSYYLGVAICKDKILASYTRRNHISKHENGRIKSNLPTKFLVFDLDGDYIETLETGYPILDFIYDEGNNRIIMSVEDGMIQFAYLNLDGILK